MTELCVRFGISRKTGYKLLSEVQQILKVLTV